MMMINERQILIPYYNRKHTQSCFQLGMQVTQTMYTELLFRTAKSKEAEKLREIINSRTTFFLVFFCFLGLFVIYPGWYPGQPETHPGLERNLWRHLQLEKQHKGFLVASKGSADGTQSTYNSEQGGLHLTSDDLYTPRLLTFPKTVLFLSSIDPEHRQCHKKH